MSLVSGRSLSCGTIEVFMDNSSNPPACAHAVSSLVSTEQRHSVEPVPIGLIGVGGFGGMHLRCIDLLQKQGRARLVAVTDPSDKLAGEKQRLSALGIRWYTDYRE